jgi:hypothetical protein
VTFTDPDSTRVFVTADTGRIVAVRTGTWRLYDFFWGLHIMDWKNHEDFNTPWLLGFALGGLALWLGGAVLLTCVGRSGRVVTPGANPSSARECVMDHNDDKMNMGMGYGRFAAMIATSTVVMFGLMYVNVYASVTSNLAKRGSGWRSSWPDDGAHHGRLHVVDVQKQANQRLHPGWKRRGVRRSALAGPQPGNG